MMVDFNCTSSPHGLNIYGIKSPIAKRENVIPSIKKECFCAWKSLQFFLFFLYFLMVKVSFYCITWNWDAIRALNGFKLAFGTVLGERLQNTEITSKFLKVYLPNQTIIPEGFLIIQTLFPRVFTWTFSQKLKMQIGKSNEHNPRKIPMTKIRRK